MSVPSVPMFVEAYEESYSLLVGATPEQCDSGAEPACSPIVPYGTQAAVSFAGVLFTTTVQAEDETTTVSAFGPVRNGQSTVEMIRGVLVLDADEPGEEEEEEEEEEGEEEEGEEDETPDAEDEDGAEDADEEEDEDEEEGEDEDEPQPGKGGR